MGIEDLVALIVANKSLATLVSAVHNNRIDIFGLPIFVAVSFTGPLITELPVLLYRSYAQASKTKRFHYIFFLVKFQ